MAYLYNTEVLMKHIIQKIKEYDTIIIHRHIRPDGDCIGCQIGLKEIINESFPNKKVYLVGEESEEFYYLGRMDIIDDNVYENALVIIVDVANKERISDKRYNLGRELIKIDHHPLVSKYCDYEWVDTSFSSCCEMITTFYLENKNELRLNKNGAKALFYGIVTDTNRFLNPDVSKRTFYLVNKLLEFNLNINEIYSNIYQEKFNITRLKGYVLSNFILTKNGLGYLKIDKKLCDEYSVNSSISNILVNTLAYTNNLQIWFIAIYDYKTDKVRISLRSRKLAINQIAEKYGGGGHEHASGILVDNFSIVDQLVIDIEHYLEKKASFL